MQKCFEMNLKPREQCIKFLAHGDQISWTPLSHEELSTLIDGFVWGVISINTLEPRDIRVVIKDVDARKKPIIKSFWEIFGRAERVQIWKKVEIGLESLKE